MGKLNQRDASISLKNMAPVTKSLACVRRPNFNTFTLRLLSFFCILMPVITSTCNPARETKYE